VELSLNHELPTEGDPVGALFQSDPADREFVHYAALRGVCFSTVISYGNASKIHKTELLNYSATHSDTRVIASCTE